MCSLLSPHSCSRGFILFILINKQQDFKKRIKNFSVLFDKVIKKKKYFSVNNLWIFSDKYVFYFGKRLINVKTFLRPDCFEFHCKVILYLIPKFQYRK